MEVRARAPGKIILAGEHAVVHGFTAVATAIDLYTYVSLCFPENDDTLKLQLKDMALEFSWPVGRIKEALPNLGGPLPSAPTSCSPELISSIMVLIDQQNIPEAKIGLISGVTAFLWLYTSIQGFKPAKLVVTSELPLGSGLGSSAAFCVSLSAALLALSDSVELDHSHQGWLMFGESELELVNKWAFEGNMIMYKLGSLACIKSNMPLKMLVTNTKVGRNTKALLAGVSERTSRHHDAMTAVFKAVDFISKELSSIIQAPALDDHATTEKEGKIEELMEMNQGLLQCMGATHASIETVLQTTLKYKLASKLTGAGGGGCVLTFLPSQVSGTVVDKVVAELESCGFQCFIARIGGNGLEINFGGSS
ncbi:mevalonate kinase-like isoform X2 [Malania oleifera]|uniref:mevalonate kinase-like isoform X2 n=1 Tax=Malania oleifera TaxID=397392 RepID=UPI0025AEA7E1|nr:mevalonate kinase-like isoform X2 [Malania oleifera]XP_057960460.1 mevalonate kinase-like isoform X2 [Malania oleifera]